MSKKHNNSKLITHVNHNRLMEDKKIMINNLNYQ
jgi:hypothetical protein